MKKRFLLFAILFFVCGFTLAAAEKEIRQASHRDSLYWERLSRRIRIFAVCMMTLNLKAFLQVSLWNEKRQILRLCLVNPMAR